MWPAYELTTQYLCSKHFDRAFLCLEFTTHVTTRVTYGKDQVQVSLKTSAGYMEQTSFNPRAAKKNLTFIHLKNELSYERHITV